MLKEEKLEELKSELRKAFSDYYEEAGGWEYRYHHLLRVRRYALRIMEEEELKSEVDPVVLEVAALFHDIGRKEDIEKNYLDPMKTKDGHDEAGAELVEEHVSGLVSQEQLEKIEKVIENHHSEPEMIETKIVQDADDLGKFSSIDLWRLIHYASDNERTLPETVEYFQDELEPENRDLLERLHFQTSLEAAEERLDEYSETIERMRKESLGEDI